MFQLSCFSDEIAPDLPDQIRVIRSLGLKRLEIRSVGGTGVMELDDGTLRGIRKTCRENGLSITCVSSSIGKERADCGREKTVSDVLRACGIADLFGCRYIRVFSFFRRDIPEQEAFRLSLGNLEAMAEAAFGRGKVLVMESGADTVGARSARTLELFRSVGSPALRCAFDPAALLAAGDEPFPESLPALSPYIEYVHIKDMKRGAAERVPAGEGDTCLPEILSALKDRSLVLSLEPHLAYAGARGGFSGEEAFRRAHRALAAILEQLEVDYE